MSNTEQPPEKPTVEIAAVPAWAIELTREVRGARADIALVSNDLSIVKDRVGIIESWKNDQDARASRNSDRAKQASSADLAHEAQLSDEIVARKALGTKVDDLVSSQSVQLAILTRLDSVARNPAIKLILTVVATALATWAASKGLK